MNTIIIPFPQQGRALTRGTMYLSANDTLREARESLFILPSACWDGMVKSEMLFVNTFYPVAQFGNAC
jgi:hypothetical protein